MFFRSSVKQQPAGKPDKAYETRNYKRPTPSPRRMRCDWRNYGRSHKNSNVCACVENSCCQGAFLSWKPFSDRLDASRKVARFSKSKCKARPGEANNRTNSCVRDGRYAPEEH